MKKASILHRTVLALLPATLLFAACGKSDTPVPISAPVDHGRVVFVNAAAHIAPTTLKFTVDNSEKASLTYGTTSSYQDINAGSRALQVTAGSQTALTQPIGIDKDKNYTFVATATSSTSSVGGLLLADDLTAPATGKARVRVINLGQGVATPIRLSQVTSTAGGPVVFDIVPNVANASASGFIEFNPGIYSLSILDNSGATLTVVGDGSGSGTGSKKYEEGKIYTVLVSGTAGSLNQDQKLKAFISLNN